MPPGAPLTPTNPKGRKGLRQLSSCCTGVPGAMHEIGAVRAAPTALAGFPQWPLLPRPIRHVLTLAEEDQIRSTRAFSGRYNLAQEVR